MQDNLGKLAGRDRKSTIVVSSTSKSGATIMPDISVVSSHFEAFWFLTKFAGISCGVPQAKSEIAFSRTNR